MMPFWVLLPLPDAHAAAYYLQHLRQFSSLYPLPQDVAAGAAEAVYSLPVQASHRLSAAQLMQSRSPDGYAVPAYFVTYYRTAASVWNHWMTRAAMPERRRQMQGRVTGRMLHCLCHRSHDAAYCQPYSRVVRSPHRRWTIPAQWCQT